MRRPDRASAAAAGVATAVLFGFVLVSTAALAAGVETVARAEFPLAEEGG